MTFAATAAIGRLLIRDKHYGKGTPRDRQAAMEERAAVHGHTREARERGEMSQREVQDARYKIGLKVESSYHSGYAKPLELGGALFMCVCLSYLRGWRSPIGEVMDTVGHTGDEEDDYSFEERFDGLIILARPGRRQRTGNSRCKQWQWRRSTRRMTG